MAVKIVEADYDNPRQAGHVLELTNIYSQDPMGQNAPLSDYSKEHLIEELKTLPTAFSLIAYLDDEPVGLANCIISFSTFYAKKLINIHDLMVKPDARGNGIGRKLLEAVEEKARDQNYCKITLEVRCDNRARNLYERFGFHPDDVPLDFWIKELE